MAGALRVDRSYLGLEPSAQAVVLRPYIINGRSYQIRTDGPFTVTGFQDQLIKPLSQASIWWQRLESNKLFLDYGPSEIPFLYSAIYVKCLLFTE